MSKFLTKNKKIIDFEELGFETTLESGDIEIAKPICALDLLAYAESLQPKLITLELEVQLNKQKSDALRDFLYNRSVPVDDAEMLTHRKTAHTLLALLTGAALACLVVQTITFYLLGIGLLLAFVAALGATSLPLVVGHFAYEELVARSKGLRIAIAILGVGLCFGGFLRFGEARQLMLQKATELPVTDTYVDDTSGDSSVSRPPAEREPALHDDSESRIHEAFGNALLLFMFAADLMLGYFVGRLSLLYSNRDYAAWRKLHDTAVLVTRLKEEISEIDASIEIAQRRCMAGILRAQCTQRKARIPYYRALGVVAVGVCALLELPKLQAQAADRYEGILIDTSASFLKGPAGDHVFQECLASTKNLLLTEPPNSRVWVSRITSDSFGSVLEISKGWTPPVHGIFTDDLNRARHQLASSFESKSIAMTPVSPRTDIFGGLWRLKTFFESGAKSDASLKFPKTIWILSDMVNDTAEFQMLRLIAGGPQRMLEHAKANSLVVPLHGYRIYIRGASASGLTPRTWTTVQQFWVLYFSAAGAELVSYSPECTVQR